MVGFSATGTTPNHGVEDSSQFDKITFLERRIYDLQEELRVVNEKNKQLSAAMALEDSETAWPTLHRVCCAQRKGQVTYVDKPYLMDGQDSSHLEGLYMVDEEGWEYRNSRIAFVVYETHECHSSHSSTTRVTNVTSTGVQEEIQILSQPLLDLLREQSEKILGLQSYMERGLLEEDIIRPPYVFFFHFGVDIQESAHVKEHEAYDDFLVLWSFLEQRTQELRIHISACFDSGYVEYEHIAWLFKPGDLLIVRSDVSIVVEQIKVIQQNRSSDENTIGIHISSIRFETFVVERPGQHMDSSKGPFSAS